MILVIKIYLNVILQGLYNMGKRKIKNNTSPKKQIKSEKPTENTNNTGFLIDLSFEGLYYSVEYKEFTNFLQDEDEFVEKFRSIRVLLSKISNKKFLEDLIHSMRHCHIVEGKKLKITLECIKKSLKKYDDKKDVTSYLEQLLGNEKIYQIGFEDTIRLIGTYDENNNVFRVYLVDYHHRLFYNQSRNSINVRQKRFCPMTSE